VIATRCEGCGGTFEVDDAWAGRRARCRRCGTVIAIPELDIFEIRDDAPLPLAGGEEEDSRPEPAAVPVEAVPDDAPIVLDHATGEKARAAVRAAAGYTTTEPRRSFWADLAYSFVFPFPGTNAIRFASVVAFYLIYAFLGYAAWYGTVGRGAIAGWLSAYFFSIIQDTCAGEDCLSGFSLESGYDGIVAPFFAMLGTYLWVGWPWIIWWAVMSSRGGILPDPTADLAVSIGLYALAVFLWPMTVLTVAIFGFSMDVLRYDRQLLTIGRNFGPYAIVILALGLTAAIAVGFRQLVQRVPLASGAGIAWSLGGAVISAYVAVVTMRTIGLFYRHNKRHFAWEAE